MINEITRLFQSAEKTIDKPILPSYIFYVSDKGIDKAIYDLGTKKTHLEICEVEQEFLIDMGLMNKVNYSLTDEGKGYFETRFIHGNIAEAELFIKQKLQQNPIVNLVCQVFYGRGKIGYQQLVALLNHHKVDDHELTRQNIFPFLVLLNKFKILVLDKKNGTFYLKEPLVSDVVIKQYYISPSTPFSNLLNIKKTLRSCKGDIYWIDKHFRKEAFEIIIDGLSPDGVKSLTIISTDENATQSAKADFELLKQELAARNIILAWLVLTDKTLKLHDRWLISDNNVYNIPPVLAIIRGQMAEIIKTESKIDLKLLIQNSVSV
ncbi:MAG: hypothetical protein FWD89_00370 [Firmicutes bacterium]|nr:hypothetical protein [Bacillota bacterium]